MNLSKLKNLLRYLICLVALLNFSGCSINKNYFKVSSELYATKDKDKLNPYFSIVHEDDKFSWLYYSLNSEELKYKKTDFDSLYTSAIKISYKLPENYGSKKAGDTMFFILLDHVKKIVQHQVTGKVKLKIPIGYTSFTDISIFDMNSGKRGSDILFINKKNNYVNQNYYINSKQKLQDNDDFLYTGDSITFFNNRLNNIKSLLLNYYEFSRSISLPPFSKNQLSSDLVVKNKSKITSTSGIFSFTPESPGLYYIFPDSTIKGGLNLNVFPKYFPELKIEKHRGYSLRYILKNEEYENLVKKDTFRNELIEIWKIFCGSDQRAIGLMNEWDNRVKITNSYFSSYKEGWKTDRGMIYILFGKPAYIEKSNDKEIWFYGDKRSITGFNFEFNRINNFLSDNDYELLRNDTFKNIWFNAVDVWRKGRVYNGN